MSIFILLIIALTAHSENINTHTFPNDFLFGVASSAYQTEGAWNVDGKGESIWDYFAHNHPDKIADRSNADITCNSYYKTKEDVALLKQLGVNFYRFSISWPRILPNGFSNKINQAGIDYYNDLLDELLNNGITPMVTMYHWDLPQTLSNFGGFTNAEIVNWFENYAKILFKYFGDKVKIWITFNEPGFICKWGYGTGTLAPGFSYSGIADYRCYHNLLNAHARVYHFYKNHHKSKQKGRVGIATDLQWYEPATNSTADRNAALRILEFDYCVILHTIFSKKGDYPEMVKTRIQNRSVKEGFENSRLPTFTNKEIKMLRGSADFLGINQYTTFLVRDREEYPIGQPSQEKDTNAAYSQDPSWEGGVRDILKTVPWGMRKALKWVKDNYEKIDVFILENGYGDKSTINDHIRIDYHKLYLSNVLDAIYEDQVPVRGYAVWSLFDSFEWDLGFTSAFGLYQVNFSDPNRARTPKESATFYAKLIQDRRLPSAKDEL